MRSQLLRATAVAAGALVLGAAGWSMATRAQAAPAAESRDALTRGFSKGAWDHQSIGPLAFSPSGVLFFADDQAGAIYGVDLAETRSQAAPYARVPELGATLAARLGTTPAGIEIKDLAVSPVSHAVYLSVRKTDGADNNPADPANYALFSVAPSGEITAVDLASKPFARVSLNAAKGRDPRLVTDLAYAKGRLLVASLSKEQFDSNLISVPVPFNGGVERFATSIYHVSHKRQETASPIQTLTVYRDGDREYLMAAYVCTPVVRFNLDDLKPGATVTGVTVAELGSQNRPMAMVAYGDPGKQSLLLNNSRFGVLKVDRKIAMETSAVNEKTTADRGDRGMTPFPGIEAVESLKDARAYTAADRQLLVVKPTDGGMSLEPMPLP
ncbi:MAG: hypothetical protein ACK47B_07435 [Armatimonadota bacterium]